MPGFFPARQFCCCIIFWIFGAWEIQNFRRPKKRFVSGLGGLIEHVCRQAARINLHKRYGHSGFCAVKVKKKRRCLVITWFQEGIIFFALNMARRWALHSQLFECLQEKYYRHALEHLEPVRSAETNEQKNNFLRKRLTTFDLFEGLCGCSGHNFAGSASPRPLTRKTGYLILFRCSLRSVWWHICATRDVIAIGFRRGQRGDMFEPTCTRCAIQNMFESMSTASSNLQ